MKRHLPLLGLLVFQLWVLLPDALPANLTPMDKDPAVTPSEWLGCQRIDFVVAGRPALLIIPDHAAPGNPWIWRTEWFGHFPAADLALVARGWHLGYINVKDMYGGPASMQLLDAYYQYVRKERGLAPRVVLEGFSRGGAYAVNFAAAWPDRVAALYLDAPTLDLTSWPGRKSRLWPECLAAYGITDAQFATAKVNPIDHAEMLAKAGIPVIGVSGDADKTVSYRDNLAAFATRYRAAGGLIEVIVKPGGDHHPHSLADPKPIVEFLVAHSATKSK